MPASYTSRVRRARERDTRSELLLQCLRLRLDPSAGVAVRDSARALDVGWDSLRPVVKAEGLASVLYETMAKLEVLPADVIRALGRRHRAGAERNALVQAVLRECLRELAAAGVAVIVLKGAALAETVYRSWTVRPMWDLDLLIHRRDLERTRAVLEALGYVMLRRETQIGVLAAYENELVFRKPCPVAIPIDVHWSLFDSPEHQSQTCDWLWEGAEPAQIAGSPALVLAPEAQILHLCGHLALHHAGEGLRWWHDIAEALVAYRERLDWSRLSLRARRHGLVLPLREILTRLSGDWGAPVPEEVLDELRRYQPTRREQRIFERHWRRRRSAGLRFWHDLTSMPSGRQRRHFALANLFPSAAYMRQRYGVHSRLLLPLLYPYRWLRGLLAGRL